LVMFELLFINMLNIECNTIQPHTIKLQDERSLKLVFGKWIIKRVDTNDLTATLQSITIIHKEQEHLLIFDGTYMVNIGFEN